MDVSNGGDAMNKFSLIIPEFNGRAIAQRYYAITRPDRNYTGRQAWVQLKQDKRLQQTILTHVVKEFHDRQQKIIAKYFADAWRTPHK